MPINPSRDEAGWWLKFGAFEREAEYLNRRISTGDRATYACSRPLGNRLGLVSSRSCSRVVCAKRFIITSFAKRNMPKFISAISVAQKGAFLNTLGSETS